MTWYKNYVFILYEELGKCSIIIKSKNIVLNIYSEFNQRNNTYILPERYHCIAVSLRRESKNFLRHT